ncbi:MAG TPA: zinc metallopeptidase [Lachnospiraceae bacterium]|nr:zinc metallopeptidase [Lachnospiraceae bacterium]
MLLFGLYGGYYGGYYMDWTYVLVLIGAVISIIASSRVNSTFHKYAKVKSMSGMTGSETAQMILNYAGIHDVKIERISGKLSDHYDPRDKVLRLSDSTYADTSVAAIGVAAHECGHAIQHQENYGPLALRSTLVPVANVGSKLGIPIIILGVIMSYNYTLIQLGIWVFAIAVLFQLVTLPVEFNASGRAIKLLEQYKILGSNEIKDCKKVLGAAAMTYVAAAAATILQLLRLVVLFGGKRDD